MKPFSFKSENLAVDYISFNITGLTNPESIAKIASYLSKSFVFNSQIKEKHDKHFQDLVLEENNAFQVRFLRSLRNTAFKTYWDGTTLHFSGSNAAFFYNLTQKGFISWEMFSSGILNRFDLCFSRNNKISDRISTQKFLENCQRELNQKHRNPNPKPQTPNPKPQHHL